MRLALIGAAGCVGALARYGIGQLVGRAATGPFPWPTVVVNVSGSLVLGLVAALLAARDPADPVRAAVTIGLLGAYTTFSTFSAETFRLVEDGAIWLAAGNVAISVAAGLLAFAVGTGIGRAL